MIIAIAVIVSPSVGFDSESAADVQRFAAFGKCDGLRRQARSAEG
jgi:hypothetical protein